MAARVGDDNFVPYVPRQLNRMSSGLVGPAQNRVPEINQAPGCEDNTNAARESKAESPTPADVENQAEPTAQTIDDPGAARSPAASQPTTSCDGNHCDHALEIRREAIRLAAIACGRALRHAVVVHPGVIAAFVDDAIAAAGLPQHARIRVHPGSIAQMSASHHDRIGDDDLSLGDVVVECNGVTVGADTETRASLLVTAATEA